jgi:hypothetical protein
MMESMARTRSFFQKPSSREDAQHQLTAKVAALARLAGWSVKDLARAFVSTPPCPPITSQAQWTKLSAIARAELELQAGLDVTKLPTTDGRLDLPEPFASLVSAGAMPENEARARFDASVARYEDYVASMEGSTPKAEPGPFVGGADVGRHLTAAIRDCKLSGVGPKDLLTEFGRTRINFPESRAAYDALSADGHAFIDALLPDMDPMQLPSGAGTRGTRSEVNDLPADLRKAVEDRKITLERAKAMVTNDVASLNALAAAHSPQRAPAPAPEPSDAA